MKEIVALFENVDQVTLNDRTIYLVGTAHISKSSADLAEQIIREKAPDSVAVELCESRFQSLKDPERWKNMDIVAVIRAGKSYVLMAQLALAGFQRKLGKQLQINPGAEMMRAISIAEELQCHTVLADRDIKTTLKRTWASLGVVTMCKLLWAMMSGLLTNQKITDQEIEALKTSDALSELLKEFSAALPNVRTALIDERDQYLAKKIELAPGKNVVAIIGAGHIPGIKRWLGERVDLQELETIPAKSKTSTLMSWVIPSIVMGIIIASLFTSGFDTSTEMIKAWFWITGIFAAIGSAVALAHPLTILTSFVTAPFTTLNPVLASGWFAGLVEAMIRKPRVADLERIADDITTVRGIWSNRVSRILLVIALTNLFGTIGTLWGIKVVASLL